MCEKSNTFWRFARSLTLKVKKNAKSKKREVEICWFFANKNHSKTSNGRILFDFLTFCEKFCDFHAVRLPARGALRNSKQFQFAASESARTGQVQRFFGLTDTCGSDAQSPDWDELTSLWRWCRLMSQWTNACYPRCQGATTMCAKALWQKFVLDLEQ